MFDDYLSARENDFPPNIDAILAAHPDLEEALTASLRSLAFLDRATSQMTCDEGGPGRADNSPGALRKAARRLHSRS